jgi:hypothetical protein
MIRHPEASTWVTGIESAGQDGFGVGGIDTTPFGHPYVVAAEVPEDVDCTEECESVPLPCIRHAGWADNGRDTVSFFAGGDEACVASAKLGGVKLTLTGLRCPKESACVETTLVKECPGRRCNLELSMPYSFGETASYRTIAKWEFGDGRVSTATVSGLCHRLSPLDECPDPDFGYKEFFRY